MAFLLTTDQQELFLKILSGTLPHENFVSEIAGDILDELVKLIDIKELYGIPYMFWNIIQNKRVISLYRKKYNKTLTRDVFENSIIVGLQDIIKRDNFNADQFFLDYGLTYNLEIEKDLQDASNFVYSRAMETYDTMFESALTSDEAYSNIYTLREDIQRSIAVYYTSLSAEILATGIEYKYKKYYGYEDWKKFLNVINAEISRRFADETVSSIYVATRLGTFEDSLKFTEDNKYDVESLFNFGFEVFDNEFMFRTQDIVAIQANEGTGKTRLTIHAIHQALMAGVNVLVVCGETHVLKIQKLLEIYHTYYLYEMIFTLEELYNPSIIKGYDELGNESAEMTDELLTTLNSATLDLYSNEQYGKVTLIQNLTYEGCEQSINDIVVRDNIKAVFIDHVGALGHTGEYVSGQRLNTKNEQVSHLFEVEDYLVKKLNIMFFNLTHTSWEASKEIDSGKKELRTRSGADSSAISKYASHAFIMTQPKNLKKSDQIVLYTTKLRDYQNIFDPVVISRNSANIHTYREDSQYLVKGDIKQNDSVENLY